ncbi:hypothetical protein QQF64_000417 [Cirrhinus molitorella]|uniref:DIX domain-containing protein n=1 Tax=Cirrhinus molitorella TaxID=172907 RepID=A0ABR3NXG7_9TELE
MYDTERRDDQDANTANPVKMTHTPLQLNDEFEELQTNKASSADTCRRRNRHQCHYCILIMLFTKDTGECVTVVYCYGGDVIPYRTCVQGVSAVTLGLFKSLLTRRGLFRFFFKTASVEFDCGAVYEEIREDAAVLPTFDRKIIARVERMSE